MCAEVTIVELTNITSVTVNEVVEAIHRLSEDG